MFSSSGRSVLAAQRNGIVWRSALAICAISAACSLHKRIRLRFPTTPQDRLTELLSDVRFETHPQAARKRAP